MAMSRCVATSWELWMLGIFSKAFSWPESAFLESLRQKAARVESVEKLLEHFRELCFLQQISSWIFVAVGLQLVPPGVFHGAKNPHIQRLELICAVRRQTDVGNVVCLAKFYDLSRNV
jgi:hypothetical protein